MSNNKKLSKIDGPSSGTRFWLLLIYAICLWQSGCTSAPQAEDVDTDFRMLADRPLAYSSAVPALSIAARDYVYLLPIEQFTAGRWTPSLWVGIASTLDRDFQGLRLVQPTQLVFNIDSKVVRLPLAPWDISLQPPITTKVEVVHNLRSVVDYELLQALSNAKDVELTLGRLPVGQQNFSLWRGSWQDTQNQATTANVEIAAKAHRPPIIQQQ